MWHRPLCRQQVLAKQWIFYENTHSMTYSPWTQPMGEKTKTKIETILLNSHTVRIPNSLNGNISYAIAYFLLYFRFNRDDTKPCETHIKSDVSAAPMGTDTRNAHICHQKTWNVKLRKVVIIAHTQIFVFVIIFTPYYGSQCLLNRPKYIIISDCVLFSSHFQ